MGSIEKQFQDATILSSVVPDETTGQPLDLKRIKAALETFDPESVEAKELFSILFKNVVAYGTCRNNSSPLVNILGFDFSQDYPIQKNSGYVKELHVHANSEEAFIQLKKYQEYIKYIRIECPTTWREVVARERNIKKQEVVTDCHVHKNFEQYNKHLQELVNYPTVTRLAVECSCTQLYVNENIQRLRINSCRRIKEVPEREPLAPYSVYWPCCAVQSLVDITKAQTSVTELTLGERFYVRMIDGSEFAPYINLQKLLILEYLNSVSSTNLKKDCLPNLKELKIRGGTNTTETFDLSDLPNLQKVHITDLMFDSLDFMPINIKEIRFNSFEVFSLDVLSKYTELEYLELSENLPLEDIPGTWGKNKNKLKTLIARDSRMFEHFEEFPRFINLKELLLASNIVGDGYLSFIETKVPSLERLDLECTPLWDIKALCKLNNLKELNLSDTMITEIPEEISHLRELEILVLENNQIKIGIGRLASLPKLKQLFIHGSNIPNSGLLRQILLGVKIESKRWKCRWIDDNEENYTMP